MCPGKEACIIKKSEDIEMVCFAQESPLKTVETLRLAARALLKQELNDIDRLI